MKLKGFLGGNTKGSKILRKTTLKRRQFHLSRTKNEEEVDQNEHYEACELC